MRLFECGILFNNLFFFFRIAQKTEICFQVHFFSGFNSCLLECFVKEMKRNKKIEMMQGFGLRFYSTLLYNLPFFNSCSKLSRMKRRVYR